MNGGRNCYLTIILCCFITIPTTYWAFGTLRGFDSFGLLFASCLCGVFSGLLLSLIIKLIID